MISKLIAVAMATVVLIGCGGRGESSPPPAEFGDSTDVPEPFRTAAIDQAAEDSGVPADEIVVVGGLPTTWSDSSLGCREDGYGYAQVVVDGWRVLVDTGDDVREYHAGRTNAKPAC